MKRVFLIATLLFCLSPSRGTAAVAADDVYISIFNIIMAGDSMKDKGQGRTALEKYLEAERDLKKLKSAYPTWNSKIVGFRLKYLADRIGPLKVQYPGTTIPVKKVVDTDSGSQTTAAKGPGGVTGAIRDLNSKLIDTNQENSRLRDQLREALSARPAEADPAAYAKAQERIRTLQQGTDVSSITLEQQKSELQQLRENYEDLQKRMAVLASRSKEEQLRQENAMLKQQVAQLNELAGALPNVDEIKRRVSLLETDLKNAEAARQSLAVEKAQMERQLAAADTGRLNAENAALKGQVAKLNELARQVGNVEATNQRLRQVEAELKAQQTLAGELTRQNQQLETRLREGDLPRLKAENQSLKSEVGRLSQVAARVPDLEELRGELATVRAKAQAEQALREKLVRDKEKLESLLTDPNLQIGTGPSEEFKTLETEKKALESQLRKLADEQRKTSAVAADANRKSTEQAARLEQLERERLELRKALEKAMKDLEAEKRSASKAATTTSKPAEDPQLKKKLQVAEAKIQVLEAKASPRTADELALIRSAASVPVTAPPAPAPQQPKRDFPANAGQIALDAQRAYNTQRYAEAEAKFKEVLSLEKDNVFTLANLAAAQMELNKLGEAEANLSRALSIHSDDAFSLSLKGLVKFRQNDYDSALDLLSQSAVLDPKNAQTQNYLGLALSQKGLRIAAEAAFRKAVKLAPGYAVAHYNLAVFYATGDAPSPELARWHYQKALASGHPKSADLEKMLAAR